MPFHTWQTVRQEHTKVLRSGGIRSDRSFANPVNGPKSIADVENDLKVDSRQYLDDREAEWLWADKLTQAGVSGERKEFIGFAHYFLDVIRCEQSWWREDRPWFGIYSICSSVTE